MRLNWDQLENDWTKFTVAVREAWDDLSDAELDRIAGQRDRFVDCIQEHDGIGRKQAERKVDDFVARLQPIFRTPS
jgi:uncharacterized protein YjbJ (UPF0337 family)